MASYIEAVELVSEIIPRYDGNEKGLSGFINLLEVVESIINKDYETEIITLIKSKLDGKARLAVGKNPENINNIIKSLKDRCQVKTTSESILHKITSIRQIGTIEDYGYIIEDLTQKLEERYVAEGYSIQNAAQKAVQLGINAFRIGLRDTDIRIIMRSSEFRTMQEAIEKAVELENENYIFRQTEVHASTSRIQIYQDNRKHVYKNWEKNHKTIQYNNYNENQYSNSLQSYHPMNHNCISDRYTNPFEYNKYHRQIKLDHKKNENHSWNNHRDKNRLQGKLSYYKYTYDSNKHEHEEVVKNILQTRKHESNESSTNFEERNLSNLEMNMYNQEEYFNNDKGSNELYNIKGKEHEIENENDEITDYINEEMNETTNQYTLYHDSTQLIHERICDNHVIENNIKEKDENDMFEMNILCNEEYEKDMNVQQDTGNKAIKVQNDANDKHKRVKKKKRMELHEYNIPNNCPIEEATNIENMNMNHSTIKEELRKLSIIEKVKEKFKKVLKERLHKFLSKIKQTNEENDFQQITFTPKESKLSRKSLKPSTFNFRLLNSKLLVNNSMYIKFYPP